MNQQELQQLDEFIANWQETPTRAKATFLQLKAHLESQAGAVLSFKARPGVSFSLRGAHPGDNRELYVMIDVIDDDPDNRWFSVCFYGEMITDPDELGDLIPGGLLGEDGYCFDMEEDDDALRNYLIARIDEAYKTASTS